MKIRISNERLLAAGGVVAGAGFLGGALGGPVGAMAGAVVGLALAFYTFKPRH